MVNGGFIGFPVEAGENYIEMYFTAYGYKTGKILGMFGMICLFFIIIKKYLKKGNKM